MCHFFLSPKEKSRPPPGQAERDIVTAATWCMNFKKSDSWSGSTKVHLSILNLSNFERGRADNRVT